MFEAASNREILDVEKIKRNDCCNLGLWIQSEGKRLYGHKIEFISLMDVHTEFHSVAGIVAGLINEQEYDKAKGHLGTSSQFSFASASVGIAITKLRVAVLQGEVDGERSDVGGSDLEIL